MSTPLPLRLSSLVSKEVHVQNKIVFSNPAVVLTGSNTSLLFDRLHTLEDEVAELQANGGGGGPVSTPEFIYPSITCNTYASLTLQLLDGAALNSTKTYNTFGRFSFADTESALTFGSFSLPNANSETHFRILNETNLSAGSGFPLTTALVLNYTNTDLSQGVFSMSSELISARNPNGFWSFYTGS